MHESDGACVGDLAVTSDTIEQCDGLGSTEQWTLEHVRAGRIESFRRLSGHCVEGLSHLAASIQLAYETVLFESLAKQQDRVDSPKLLAPDVGKRWKAEFEHAMGATFMSGSTQKMAREVGHRGFLTEWIDILLDRLRQGGPPSAMVLAHLYEDGRAWLDTIITDNSSLDLTKRRGVFYTPPHIVDELLDDSLGIRLETETLSSIESFAILDPACGGGVFLFEAFTRLADWYLTQYSKAPERWCSQSRVEWREGVLTLTQSERERILNCHIFGVDIDPNALMISRRVLSLALGTTTTDGVNPRELQGNLICGNSLLKSACTGLAESFDWSMAFVPMAERGGFDLILGNPPYVYARGAGFTEAEKRYYQSAYAVEGGLNTYVLFVLRAIEILRPHGHLAVIIPNTWMTLTSLKFFRTKLLTTLSDIEIIRHDYPVFGRAAVETCCLTGRLASPTTIQLSIASAPKQKHMHSRRDASAARKQETIDFTIDDTTRASIMARINGAPRLGDLATVRTGLKAYQTGKGTPPQTVQQKRNRAFHREHKTCPSDHPYLHGSDVRRFRLEWSGEWLSYGPWLAERRPSAPFDGPRILVRQIPSKPPYCIQACRVHQTYYHDINSMVVFDIDVDPRVILGFLNSRLISFWFMTTYQKHQRALFPQFKVRELRVFPMAVGTSYDGLIAELVSALEDAHSSHLPSTKTTSLATVRALQTRLDEIVCQAYGLSSSEIAYFKALAPE